MSHDAELERLNRIADVFDSAFDFDVYYQLGLGRALAPLLRGKICLEVGCASGVMSPLLAEAAARLDMVDGSDAYIRAAREKLTGQRVRLFTSLFEDFTPDCRYDAIVCSHVLEHVFSPLDLLTRMASWLAPGGKIYLCVPNAYSVHRMLGVEMGLSTDVHEPSERDRLVGHRRVYDKQSLSADITQAGLKHGPLQGVLLKPFPNSRMAELPKTVTEGLLTLGAQIPDHASEIYYECWI